MDRCTDPAPVKEVAKAPQNAVLGNEGTARFATKDRMNGRMVVKVQVNGEVTPVRCKGESFESSKEFSSLLGEDPRRTWEEPNSHV